MEPYLGVIALFDPETNHKFDQLNQILKRAGIKTIDIPPHLTLGIYQGVTVNELGKWLEQVCTGRKRIKLSLNHIGMFGAEVLFLAPKVTRELLSLHESLHARYDDCHGEIGVHYSLRNNNFVPHASLVVNDTEQVLKAVPVVIDNFHPIQGEIAAVGLYTFYPMKQLQVFELEPW